MLDDKLTINESIILDATLYIFIKVADLYKPCIVLYFACPLSLKGNKIQEIKGVLANHSICNSLSSLTLNCKVHAQFILDAIEVVWELLIIRELFIGEKFTTEEVNIFEWVHYYVLITCKYRPEGLLQELHGHFTRSSLLSQSSSSGLFLLNEVSFPSSLHLNPCIPKNHYQNNHLQLILNSPNTSGLAGICLKL